jgi:hypothetical protein
MTARGIRDSLAVSGYNLEQHSNPLASIHGVLKRLAERGDVEQLEAEGKTRYRWKEKTVTIKASGVIRTESTIERATRRATEETTRNPRELKAIASAIEDIERLKGKI